MLAKAWIREMLDGVDFNAKPKAWRWLNALYMAVNNSSELNSHQENLVNTICGEVSCQMRVNAGEKIPDDVFIVAAWINTCK